MPDRLQWTDAQGVHEDRLPLEPGIGEMLNDQFHRLVRGEPSLAPTWDDSIAVARLLAEIRRSGREGRRIHDRNGRSPALIGVDPFDRPDPDHERHD